MLRVNDSIRARRDGERGRGEKAERDETKKNLQDATGVVCR